MKVGLDTNVLLRLGDDAEPAQQQRARTFVASLGLGNAFVGSIVLAEFAWTLRRHYKLPRNEIANRIAIILDSPEFAVADASETERALLRYRRGPADFPDYLIAEINRSRDCSATASFDTDAIKSGDPFVPVPN